VLVTITDESLKGQLTTNADLSHDFMNTRSHMTNWDVDVRFCCLFLFLYGIKAPPIYLSFLQRTTLSFLLIYWSGTES
jgi:hypothetical protein